MRATPYKYIPLLSPAFRFLRRQAWLIRYAGSAVECLCCGKSFASWVGGKPTGRCPNCDSITRQKMLVHALGAHSRARQDTQRTLYFAPDPGPMGWLQRTGGFAVTTTDYSAPGVDEHWDITDIPQADRTYDVILCSHVLEHVPEDRKAMSELHRILKADGVLFLQVPYDRDTPETDEDPSITDPEERIRRFGQFDHIRQYGQDLITRLEEAGFAVEIRTAENAFSEQEMTRYGLWNDILFLCRPAA